MAGRLLTAIPGQLVLSTASRSDRQASWPLQASGSKGMIPERKTPEEPGSFPFHPHATKSAPGVQLSLIRWSCGIPVLSQTPESLLRVTSVGVTSPAPVSLFLIPVPGDLRTDPYSPCTPLIPHGDAHTAPTTVGHICPQLPTRNPCGKEVETPCSTFSEV